VRSSWLVAAAVAAVVAVVEAPIVLGGRTWADRAYQTEVVPSRGAAAAAWASGRLPEWWDGSGLGVPLAAEPSHGAMYPLLAVVGEAPDPAPAIDLSIALHAALAAIGIALWARRRGCDDVVAVVAGGAIAASGALHAALLAGGFGIAWLPWAGLAAEPPDDAPLGVGARRARLRRAVALAAVIGAAGLSSSAAAIDAAIVAIAVASGSKRGRGAIGWTAGAIAVGAIACAAAWLPALVHRLGDVAPAGARAPRGDELLGWVAPAGAARFHLGAAWIALAAIGVIAARHVWSASALAIGAVACLALAWAPAAAAMDPTVHVAAASLLLCVLGAQGLDRLALDRESAVALGAAAVVIAAALASRHAGAVASIGELAGIAAIALAWPRGGAFQLATALLVVGPGFFAMRDAAPLVSRAALAETPVFAPKPGGRVYRPTPMDPDDPDPVQRAKDDHATLAGDVAARYAAATAQTSDPGRRAIEDPVWHAAGLSGGKLFDRYGIEQAILPSTVAQIIHAPAIATRGRWSLVDAQAKRPRAYVATRVRGASTPAGEVTATFPGPDERGTPLDQVAIAGEPDAGGETPAPITTCARRAEAPERVVVECAQTPAGWAVVNDAWAPGWSVTVDDHDAEGFRADALVRAVEIDAGARTIVWRYRAPWLRTGLIASGLAWVHLALFAWLSRRRRPRVT
jgi:hypothetical protein